MYSIHAFLPLYRMPYEEFIPLLRMALKKLHDHGMYLEHKWVKMRSKAAKEGIIL